MNLIIDFLNDQSSTTSIILILVGLWILSCIFKLIVIGYRYIFQNALYSVMKFLLPNKYVNRPRDEFTFEEKRWVKDLCWGRCPRCVIKNGRIFPRKATQVDHLWPSSKGGPGMKWNAVALCEICNEDEKKDKLELWAICVAFSPQILRKIKSILYRIIR